MIGPRELNVERYGDLVARLASSNESIWKTFNAYAEGRVGFTALARTDIEPEYMKKLALFIDQGLSPKDIQRWAQSYRQAYEAGIEREQLRNMPKLQAVK